IWAPLFAAYPADKPLVFNTTTPTNDLKGSLAARVQFAQSQILPLHLQKGDNQPHLIGHRKSLLMVRPLKADDASPMHVTARDKAGKTLGSVSLNPPEKLPKTAYYLDGIPDEKIEFTKQEGAANIINSMPELKKLSDPKETFLSDRLRQHALVEIQTADGQWVGDIYVPNGADLDGKMLRIRSNAGYSSTIHYSGRTVVISRDQSLQFKSVRGQWILEGELENQGLTYAAETWSGVLPAEWIAPGLRLEIQQGSFSGELTNLKVGAPSELLIHTIDVGMLAPPRDQFEFAKDPEAHREYFQTVPTSRMIVSQYAPLFLREVMLPDGTFLTDFDPSKGDWHNGTMRQNIGKELISLGIDNANYGINSSAGGGEESHPYLVAQLTAHNSHGKYANGLVVHGGSGGGGIVTLDTSLGNEFSHEVGHNYGLGHYVDGFRGSVHRSADQINSTWGWDADKNRFLPNFSPIRSGKDTCLEGQCQSPFDGRTFGLDAMAGGAPLSSFNRFTLYTPNSAAIIQRFLESKAVFDANSLTGFSKWNAGTGKMEPYSHKIDVAEQITAPVSDLSEAKIASLLAKYDLVKVAMQDGNWTKNIQIPAASSANRGRIVTIDHAAAYDSYLFINGRPVKVSRGFKKSYTSDGKRWKEGSAANQRVERKPQAFGVPVTTLVGYYDPKGELKSYIYPALHGAYGFTYKDDHSRSDEEDCHLLVETRDGPLRFRLANHRLSANVMNKFHVNIPEASQPHSVALVIRGQIVDEKPIAKVAEKLTFTVNDSSSHSGAPAKDRPVSGGSP
ncbi:MAG TPA: M66 family metalloprotease, partial [Pirellulaceae bacterium]|nr:M66 family metalloprotease [Pirellulaceae bacterium]